MKKGKLTVVIILIISLVLGYTVARYGGWALKQEKVRSTETVGASGGTYGFPFQLSDYYCVAENQCYPRFHANYRIINGLWVNVLVTSGVIAGLTLIVRRAVSHKT